MLLVFPSNSLFTLQQTERSQPESAVVFEALEPWVPAEVLVNILPPPGSRQAEALTRACSSGGGSVLRVAVERGVSAQAVEALVCVGECLRVCVCVCVCV